MVENFLADIGSFYDRDIFKDYGAHLYSKEDYKPLQYVSYWCYCDATNTLKRVANAFVVDMHHATPYKITVRMANECFEERVSFVAPVGVFSEEEIIKFLDSRGHKVEIIQVY